MLKLLRFQDLALLKNAELEFAGGLCALTGESGAGKSVVLAGLALLAGDARPRLRPSVGSTWGLVEAEFELGPNDAAREVLARAGLPVDDTLVLARRVHTSGRTKSYAQGQLVPLSVLVEVGRELVDFCDQGESHALRQPGAQLDLLDRSGRLGSARVKTRLAYENWKRLRVEQEALLLASPETEQRRDFLQFLLTELTATACDDYAQKAGQLAELERGVSTKALCSEVLAELSGDAGSVETKLSWLLRQLARSGGQELAVLTLRMEALLEQARSVSQDVRARLKSGGQEQDDVEELRVEVSRLRDLARKHRVAPDELPQKRAALERQLTEVLGAGERLNELSQQVETAHMQVLHLSQELHQTRIRAAAEISLAARTELGEVGLVAAQLEMRVVAAELGPTGTSDVSLWFSANPGHPPQPISRIASGGELSRVLLALRLATESGDAMLAFDEIDAGSGGEMATRIGRALSRASRGSQVLCITHWPQVAGQADVHFVAQKRSSGLVTETSLSRLDEGTRIAELTRMLGGAEQTARSHAVRLRRTARRSAA